MNIFWDEVFEDYDEKYINETAEKLYRSMGEERELYEMIVDKSSIKPSKWRTFAGAAAAVAVIAAGGLFLRTIFGSEEITPAQESTSATEKAPEVADAPSEMKQLNVERESALGNIYFTEVTAVENEFFGSAVTFGSRSAAAEYFAELTGCEGIGRISGSVASDYIFNEGGKDEYGAYIIYSNSNGDILAVSAAKPNTSPSEMFSTVSDMGRENYKVPMLDGKVLAFPENNSDEKISTFPKPDTAEQKAKVGGVQYDGKYYYIAEWENDGLVFSVTGSNCTGNDFLDTVSAVISDVDGLSHIMNDYVRLEVDQSKYTMDMSVFYTYFRGVWCNEDEEIDIGWNDNIFGYGSNRLIGFYKDKYGFYMLGGEGLWFMPADDTESIYFYITSQLFTDSPRASNYEKHYKKVRNAPPVGTAGEYGCLGMHELCHSLGYDYESLFDFSITDSDGGVWHRIPDFSLDWGKMYVSTRNNLEAVIHLKMISGEEEKYFSCHLVSDGETCVMTDEHYPFDISVITHEGLPTDLSAAAMADEKSDPMQAAEITTLFYPLSDGNYYAVRSVGCIQNQWISNREIFYHDGSGYKLLSDKAKAIMGVLHTVCQDDRLYIAHTDGDEYFYYYITCFSGGEMASVYHIGKEISFADFAWIFQFGVKDKVLTYEVSNSPDDYERLRECLDYTDPYNPVVISSETVDMSEAETVQAEIAAIIEQIEFVKAKQENLKADIRHMNVRIAERETKLEELALLATAENKELTEEEILRNKQILEQEKKELEDYKSALETLKENLAEYEQEQKDLEQHEAELQEKIND
ncbi:MAG: hypothetical protein IJ416_04690 [Ruminiclostridium sp.]|nr:hypothetical protein [Ruminiclostridium sp.]